MALHALHHSFFLFKHSINLLHFSQIHIYIIAVYHYSVKIQASLEAVNLSASSYYVPDFASMKYLNYGAAVSEASLCLTVFILFLCILVLLRLLTFRQPFMDAMS